MKILHFDEDDKIGEEIKSQLPGCAHYVTEAAPYLASPIIAMERPDIVICDYYFKHSTLAEGLASGLQRFKGDVYILTDECPGKVLKVIKQKFPYLLKRIKLYSKDDVDGLVADIKKTALTGRPLII